jgi:hypothetical protein
MPGRRRRPFRSRPSVSVLVGCAAGSATRRYRNAPTGGVTRRVAGCPRRAAPQGESGHSRSRCACRGASPIAGRADREGLRVRGPRRLGEPRRPLQRSPPADRLPLHVRFRGRGLAVGGLHGLFHVHRQPRKPRPSLRARHLLCAGVPCTAGEHRAVQEAHGLDHAMGFFRRKRLQYRLRRHGRCARDIRPQRLPPRRRHHLPQLLHGWARRRNTRHRLDVWEDSPAGWPQTAPEWRRPDEYENAIVRTPE